MKDFVVDGEREVDGELSLSVETTAGGVGCDGCGTREWATVGGRFECSISPRGFCLTPIVHEIADDEGAAIDRGRRERLP